MCLHATELTRVPPGSRVLLRVLPQELEWLNINRPLLADRQLRAILWADGTALDGLVRTAIDTFDWVSQLIEVPPRPLPYFAVAGVRAALTTDAAFCWHGPFLRETLIAADAPEPPLELDARQSFHSMLKRLRTPGIPVVTGIDGEREAWRIRMALALKGRHDAWIARDPAIPLPGMRLLHARQLDWDDATSRIAAVGGDRPALIAAWLDLEPESIEAILADPHHPPNVHVDLDALPRSASPPWVQRAPANLPTFLRTRDALRTREPPPDPAGLVCWSGGREPWSTGTAESAAARLTRALRYVANSRPPEPLVDAAEQSGFLDIASALRRIHHELAAPSDIPSPMRAAPLDIHSLIEWLTRSLATRQRDADAEPARADLQRDLSVTYIKLGDLHLDLGNADLARRFFEDSLAILQRLADAEPARTDLQRDLSVSYERLGDLHRSLGDTDLARRFFEDALAVAKRLADAEPARADLQRDLAVSHERMATVDTAHAREWLTTALALRRQQFAAEPNDAVVCRELAITLIQLARHLGFAEAPDLVRESHTLLSNLHRRGVLEARYQPWLEELRPYLKT